ncbi:unnamed protein product [Coffea canephora]|uniref:DH200=94 genomic scaffold, scaffold_4370 n=1 Tax=Coffea canephora TaxID=49390 RepID=A0A068VL92_COFCA|nr:unnamed protein product [Coffea canephora]
MEQILHTKGGEDEESYAKNSTFQVMFMNVNHELNRSIQEFCQANLAEAECIRVADLGCASGPNTLLAVESIIDSINRECHNLNILKLPNIQVFLNDLLSNDFNSIFKLLPSFYQKLEESYGRGSRSCFIAAMPGSFYGRLFPDNSMHFIHSSYSLHWLSQVPSGLVTEEGLPLNKGSIYIGKTSPKSVHDAYLDQFDRDFTNFLSARADELVSGGHLFVTLAPKIDDPVAYNVQDLLGMTMNDMVSEGLIDEKALDTFNLPHYRPSLEEVKTIIEKNRALKIRYLDTIQLRYRSRSLRAISEPIFQAHFGDGIMNDFFTKLAANISQHQGKMKSPINSLVLSLSRT